VPFLVFTLATLYLPNEPSLWILVSAFVGVYVSGYFWDRLILPQWRPRTWLHFQFGYMLTRFAIIAASFVAASFMPAKWSTMSICVLIGYIVFSLAISADVSCWLTHHFSKSGPPSKRLQRIVDRAARSAETKVLRIWEIDVPIDFAAASVIFRSIIFTRGSVQAHSDDELEAICLHELAHLSESGWIVAIRIVQPVLMWSPIVFLTPAVEAFGGWLLLALLLTPGLVQRVFNVFSIRMEKRADRMAVLKPENGIVYTRALDSMYRNNHVPVVMRKRSTTHPDHYDRLIAAGVTPDYPRPKPPSAFGLIGSLHLITFIAAFCGWVISGIDPNSGSSEDVHIAAER
jgi:Zn-dependent protease with chaperone function